MNHVYVVALWIGLYEAESKNYKTINGLVSIENTFFESRNTLQLSARNQWP